MKILFGVQGTGNGHVSRCRTLANALRKAGANVDYIFSGRDPKDYFDMQAFGDYKTYRGVTFATLNGKINFRKTVQRIRAFRLIKDVRELDLSKYDCIISDFEPVSAWAAHHQHRECLGISNQAVCQYLKPKEYGLVANVIMKYYAPVTKAIGLHWFHFGHKLIPPMIDTFETAPTEDGNIIVYLPFEALDEITVLLKQFKEHQFICFHPDIKQTSQQNNINFQPLGRNNFTQALVCCSGIITNTGFALISEALTLGKKILTKPVSGQFEQIYNAQCLRSLDMATVMESLNGIKLKYWLNLPSPKPIIYPDVATALANWIVSGQKESLLSLSERLWSQTIFPENVNQRIKSLGYV
ncbi:MJ1255/VC2487 family glycosyltransferase [Gilliamella sp. Pas-s25]|uniref:MJ1255/VC2487 family glycosyltransferase n=1 Tax=Gilliamella sp. Pas-s25 TaxID=2687310 RepID=UPI00135D9DE5|nr:MJ1255/VC2487 family glycosyltransferase [Gilliamella sp. Pas-s25]MWP60996.1 glycosyltransferase [Gilliamella sp. Pas-s25]